LPPPTAPDQHDQIDQRVQVQVLAVPVLAVRRLSHHLCLEAAVG